MGYVCPVCDAPQPDAEHLANHLAFTAMLRHDDHESWLDAHAPDWGSENPASLGDRLAGQLSETVVDGPTGDDAGPPRHRSHETRGQDPAQSLDAARSLDPADRAVLREAQELTRQMVADDAAEPVEEATGPAEEATGPAEEATESTDAAAPAGEPPGSDDAPDPALPDDGDDGKES